MTFAIFIDVPSEYLAGVLVEALWLPKDATRRDDHDAFHIRLVFGAIAAHLVKHFFERF